jgi:hypothetical protein
MPADPVLIAETQAWLRKAAHDLRAAGHSLTEIPPQTPGSIHGEVQFISTIV